MERTSACQRSSAMVSGVSAGTFPNAEVVKLVASTPPVKQTDRVGPCPHLGIYSASSQIQSQAYVTNHQNPISWSNMNALQAWVREGHEGSCKGRLPQSGGMRALAADGGLFEWDAAVVV